MKNIRFLIIAILIVVSLGVIYKKRYGLYNYFVYKYHGFGLISIHDSSNERIDNILTSCSLIAHAGGGIDGNKYTNSRESLLQSVANDYRLIELDLLVSSDGEILAAHDWKSFVDKSNVTEIPPKRDDFVSTKYLESYTTMDIEMINEIFLGNENLILGAVDLCSTYINQPTLVATS